MSQKDNILQELRELNSSLGHSPENIFSVPEGYFDQLTGQVINRIRALESHDPKTELELLSPVLSGLKKELPYSVPQGYFDKVVIPPSYKKSQNPGRIVPFNWLRYAAAAVITGLVILAGFYFMDRKEADQKIFVKVSREVRNMDEAQKNNLLDFIDAGLNGTETAQVSADNKTIIKTLIQGVPEKELKDFEMQTEDIQDLLLTN